MSYFRRPPAAFFSDFVLMPLATSSLGARAVTCSFVTFRSSRSVRFLAFMVIVLSFSASTKKFLNIRGWIRVKLSPLRCTDGISWNSTVGLARLHKTSVFTKQLLFVEETLGDERLNRKSLEVKIFN